MNLSHFTRTACSNYFLCTLWLWYDCKTQEVLLWIPTDMPFCLRNYVVDYWYLQISPRYCHWNECSCQYCNSFFKSFKHVQTRCWWSSDSAAPLWNYSVTIFTSIVRAEINFNKCFMNQGNKHLSVMMSSPDLFFQNRTTLKSPA